MSLVAIVEMLIFVKKSSTSVFYTKKEYLCHVKLILIKIKFKIMKKLFVVLAVVAFVIGAVSCEKKCECVAKSSLTGALDVTTEATIKKGKCSDLDQEVTTLGVTVKTTCTAK
jgi:hypothetical protein